MDHRVRISPSEDYWMYYLADHGHAVEKHIDIRPKCSCYEYYKCPVCGAMFDCDGQGILYLKRQHKGGAGYGDPNHTDILCKDMLIKDIIE